MQGAIGYGTTRAHGNVHVTRASTPDRRCSAPDPGPHAGTATGRWHILEGVATRYRISQASAGVVCIALIPACGLFDFGGPDVEELEVRIALCLGVPADQVDLELAEDGSRESISLPAHLDEGRIVECMEAAGVEVGPGGL